MEEEPTVGVPIESEEVPTMTIAMMRSFVFVVVSPVVLTLPEEAPSVVMTPAGQFPGKVPEPQSPVGVLANATGAVKKKAEANKHAIMTESIFASRRGESAAFISVS